jgi:hypothetical protein
MDDILNVAERLVAAHHESERLSAGRTLDHK